MLWFRRTDTGAIQIGPDLSSPWPWGGAAVQIGPNWAELGNCGRIGLNWAIAAELGRIGQLWSNWAELGNCGRIGLNWAIVAQLSNSSGLKCENPRRPKSVDAGSDFTDQVRHGEHFRRSFHAAHKLGLQNEPFSKIWTLFRPDFALGQTPLFGQLLGWWLG